MLHRLIVGIATILLVGIAATAHADEYGRLHDRVIRQHEFGRHQHNSRPPVVIHQHRHQHIYKERHDPFVTAHRALGVIGHAQRVFAPQVYVPPPVVYPNPPVVIYRQAPPQPQYYEYAEPVARRPPCQPQWRLFDMEARQIGWMCQ